MIAATFMSLRCVRCQLLQCHAIARLARMQLLLCHAHGACRASQCMPGLKVQG
jgi:hypothetical protein